MHIIIIHFTTISYRVKINETQIMFIPFSFLNLYGVRYCRYMIGTLIIVITVSRYLRKRHFSCVYVLILLLLNSFYSKYYIDLHENVTTILLQCGTPWWLLMPINDNIIIMYNVHQRSSNINILKIT